MPDVQRQQFRAQLLYAGGDEVVDGIDAFVGTEESSGKLPCRISKLYGDVHPSESIEQRADGCRFLRAGTGQDLGSNDRQAPQLITRLHGRPQTPDRSLVASQVVDEHRRVHHQQHDRSALLVQPGQPTPPQALDGGLAGLGPIAP